MQYFWKSEQFIVDFNEQLLKNTVKKINIAVAYITLEGARALWRSIEALELSLDKVDIYCSAQFDDKDWVQILSCLTDFARVYIVTESFLHAKVYEINTPDEVITYCGSANATKGGFKNNIELMMKHTTDKRSLEDFWEHVWQNSVDVDEDVIEAYSNFYVSTRQAQQHQWEQLQAELGAIFERQVNENDELLNVNSYFVATDYETFEPKYWEDTSQRIRLQRKDVQQKILNLHDSLESFARKLDLYPHYAKNHITSNIVPNVYNHGRLTGIWLRYGKHKTEIKLLGGNDSYQDEKSPFEQFHKHACLQLSIGEDGLQIGMFHSTANDGVDRLHVREHWDEVKDAIEEVYDRVKGYGFVWTFYDGKNERVVKNFNIDQGTAAQFLDFFYPYNEMDGCESFCMRFHPKEHETIQSFQSICDEVQKTFKAILPLYKAMAFRIPEDLR